MQSPKPPSAKGNLRAVDMQMTASQLQIGRRAKPNEPPSRLN
jgi:hypothetical protein